MSTGGKAGCLPEHPAASAWLCSFVLASQAASALKAASAPPSRQTEPSDDGDDGSQVRSEQRFEGKE